MGTEFELKYRADSAQLEAIRECWGPFSPITMETVYYDTPAGDLSRLHWTLRRRLENGRSVCTLKTPGEGHCCGEWELDAPDLAGAVTALVALGAPEELEDYCRAGLAPLCGARFTRLARKIPLEEATVELALDRGAVLGGGREAPISEVEVELKAGSREAAEAFARELVSRFGLEPEPLSKFRRAQLLTQP